MKVLYFQLVILASVTGLYLFIELRKVSPQRGSVIDKACVFITATAAIGWTIWTLLWAVRTWNYEYANHLLPLIQLCVTGFSFWLALTIRRHRLLVTEIDELRKEILSNASNNEKYQQINDVEHKDLSIIDNHMHKQFLLDSFTEAREDIIIVSGWLYKSVLTDDLIKYIQNALDRANIFLCFGWGGDKKEHRYKSTRDAIRELYQLAANVRTQNPDSGILRIYKYQTHEKLIICDDKYFTIGSYNWLTSSDEKNKEVSLKVSDKTILKEIKDRIRNEIIQNGELIRPDDTSAPTLDLVARSDNKTSELAKPCPSELTQNSNVRDDSILQMLAKPKKEERKKLMERLVNEYSENTIVSRLMADDIRLNQSVIYKNLIWCVGEINSQQAGGWLLRNLSLRSAADERALIYSALKKEKYDDLSISELSEHLKTEKSTALFYGLGALKTQCSPEISSIIIVHEALNIIEKRSDWNYQDDKIISGIGSCREWLGEQLKIISNRA